MEPTTKSRRQRRGPAADALTISVDRAAELLGISRALAYEHVKQGRIPSLRFGRKVVVPREALLRMVAQETAKALPA